MPELPEVTTTVEGLNQAARGKVIFDIWTDWPKMFRVPKFATFKKEVVGRKILGARRRGKNIFIDLSDGPSTKLGASKTILVHMKMTGHFLYGKYTLDKKHNKWSAPKGPLASDGQNRFVHAVFTLVNKHHLAFSDLRKFGHFRLCATPDVAQMADIKALGPEALEVSQKQFAEIVAKRPSGKIKQVLMDQNLIAGIGNIYSDEILWAAGIHPLAPAGKISKIQIAKLYKAMREVLKKGLKFRGDSDSDYRDIKGLPGNYQKHHRAYRRTGKPCPKRDGGTITRIKLAGRSAHFCSKHQVLNK